MVKPNKAAEINAEAKEAPVSFEQKQTLKTIADRLAGSDFFRRNYTVTELKEAFPHNPSMWTVSKMFERAEGGELYIDLPIVPHDEKLSEQKKEILLNKNYRFVVIKPHTTFQQSQEMLFEVDEKLKKGKKANGLDNSNSGLSHTG